MTRCQTLAAVLPALAALAIQPSRAEGAKCAVTQVCETGAACKALPMPMTLRLTETGNGAELRQEAEGAVFALRAVSGTPGGLRSYAGAGDGGRAAVFLTLWDDGALHLATLDLTSPENLPAVLIGTCKGGG